MCSSDLDAPALSRSLSFHASFDAGTDADFARGDRGILHAVGEARKNPRPGLGSHVRWAKDGGRFGGCLRFEKKIGPIQYFQGDENIAWKDGDFSGTLSFWLSLDPERDLLPGFCDPIQMTDKTWNDACLFVEFNKDKPRRFRMGVFSDLKTWNPTNRDWDSIPEKERPFVDGGTNLFAKGRWTHVAMTFDGYNRAGGDATTALYIDGELRGVRRAPQKFTWNPTRSALMLGLSYIGGYDEIAVFDRALTPAEVRTLFELPGGARALHPR